MSDGGAHRGRPQTRRRIRRRVRRWRYRARRTWRARRRLLALVAVAVLAAGVYLAWLVARTEQSLVDVEADAQQVSAAVAAGDDRAVEVAFARLHADALTSRDHTSGAGWWTLTHLPWVGGDARGVQMLSSAAARLSGGPLLELAQRSDQLRRMLPVHGRVDLDAVRSLAPVVGPSLRQVEATQRSLDREHPRGMIGPLGDAYDQLRSRVDDLAGALRAASIATQVLPQMLAADGTSRHYILVLQNNAEIRSTGGLPGAVSEITADRGRLRITRQTSGSAFGHSATPALPLSAAEQALYGVQLGDWFLDANLIPDFPRTAELMRAHWQQVMGDRVDGVISVDPVALSYVLEVTGPVTVDGVQLTSDDVVDQLLHETYVRLDAAGQDAFFEHVTKAIFDRVIEGVARPSKVAGALAHAVDEHRVLLHDFTPSVQQHLDPTELTGALLRDAPGHPQIGVFFNDATGAKMSYFLRYQAAITPASCVDHRQRLAATVTVRSLAPASAASMPYFVTGGGTYGVPPGDQIVTLRLYGPVGGGISDLKVDGSTAERHEAFLVDGRPVTKVWATLAPGQSHTVTWSMTTPPGQTRSTYFAMTPSVEPGRSSGVVPSACT